MELTFVLVLVAPLILGMAAGLRSMTPLAAVSWAASTGHLPLADSPLACLGWHWAPFVCGVLAVGELIADKMPFTPSRKAPGPLIGRLVVGALVGFAAGSAAGSWQIGVALGVVGALVGTFGGFALRRRLARLFGRDLPAALIEDALAIGMCVLTVAGLP